MDTPIFLQAWILLAAGFVIHGRRAHQFVWLRRHRLARLCAGWFIVLILLPFTAPFPTYHLANTAGSHPYDALPKDIKDKVGSGQDLVLAPGWCLVRPGVSVGALGEATRSGQFSAHQPRHTILRL